MDRAFVLAGGEGVRLRPFTTVLPKPLLPLGNGTIIERIIRGLADDGLVDVWVSIGYLGHLVEAVLGDGSKYGVSITYVRESSPLGTAGALMHLEVAANDRVLVINGDTYTEFGFRQALVELDKSQSDAVVVCTERSLTLEFGVIATDRDGFLDAYQEKPTSTYLVSTGINALRGIALAHLSGTPQDMPSLLESMRTSGSRVRCLVTSEAWLDLGRPEDLALANSLVDDYGYD